MIRILIGVILFWPVWYERGLKDREAFPEQENEMGGAQVSERIFG